MSKISVVLLAFVLLAQPAQAYAWGGERGGSWDRDRGRGHEWNRDRDRDCDWGRGRNGHGRQNICQLQPPYGEAVFTLPHGVLSIIIGGERYHYCDGVYYRRANARYVVVAPPQGYYY